MLESYTRKTNMDLKKVLLLDSDIRTRNWVAIRLEAMDVKVSEAMSAGEALRLLESEEIHLVVTDWPLEGDPAVAPLFQKLARESKPFILFSQAARAGDGKWVVPRDNREKLVEEVAVFFKKAVPAPVSKGRGRQILIIEDSPTLRGILRRALEKGFPEDTVREAEEGRQAFSQMSQKKVDVIITDLEMPGMDGHTFLNVLKTNPLLSKKPVLVFSSNITPQLKEQVKGMPLVRLLSKPAEPARIIQEVSALLENP